MCWECKVKGSLTRSSLASGVQWFQGCILHLEASYSCSQSVLTVWHSGGYKWATKTTNALTQHQLGDARDICFTETRAAGTLWLPVAPRERRRVPVVELPGTPGAASCHHTADLHTPNLLQGTLQTSGMMQNCSANALYVETSKSIL